MAAGVSSFIHRHNQAEHLKDSNAVAHSKLKEVCKLLIVYWYALIVFN